MANNIAWDPSLDPTVAYYVIEAGPRVSGPWQPVVSLSHSLTASWYNATARKFFYNDESLPFNTWYHIVPVDASGSIGAPSEAFTTHPMPFFVPGSTPFGFFDGDQQFAMEADALVDFTKRKLGEPVMVVHLSSSQVYASLEEACLEYSAMVNSYQAKSVLATFLGAPTGSLSGSENRYPQRNLAMELSVADAYAAEANVNSSQPLISASITLQTGQQAYDLPALLSASGQWDGQGRIRVREMFHKSPLQALRFFGTTSGLNYLNNQFRFESFTPETLFYLLPVWEDILRGMQFKTSNNVRRSNYSYALHNNVLQIFPIPQDMRQLWFTFTVDPNPSNPSGTLANPAYNGVANLSNIPFGNIQYSALNSISRHWIRRMAFNLAKEVEGQIRSKFSTVPIPNGDLTLNGPELISDARAEQEALRGELKEILEETTYQKLMEKEAQMAANLQDTFKQVPLGIYIG